MYVRIYAIVRYMTCMHLGSTVGMYVVHTISISTVCVCMYVCMYVCMCCSVLYIGVSVDEIRSKTGASFEVSDTLIPMQQ